MEKPRTARLLHQLLVLYQRVALYHRPWYRQNKTPAKRGFLVIPT